MKTHSYLLLILLAATTSMQLFADENDYRPPGNQQEKVMVFPNVIEPGDSVTVELMYVSGDACPDFELQQDSVVDNKVYVSRFRISDPDGFCAQVLTPFRAVLQLGVPDEGTEVYFEGQLIRVIKYKECKPNRLGLIVEGKNECEGRLLVRDVSNPVSSALQLFRLPATDDAAALKAGERILFAYKSERRDTSSTDSCRVLGQVTCFQLIQPVPVYMLSGVALAGTDTVLFGRAVLISKEKHRAVARTEIVNGTYTFAMVPKGEYTVQVIPQRPIYRYYLPTFYKDKLRIREADYVMLDADLLNVDVVLVQLKTRTGNGKVDGRVTYENDGLRDSVATGRPSYAPAANVANDVTVLLLDRANEVVAWTTTDDNGQYSFDGIATEGYRIVCETTSADAESDVVLSASATTATVNLVLKAPVEITAVEQLSYSALKIHPTVVTDYLTVELKEAAVLNIYTLLGQQVNQLQLEAGIHVVDVHSLPQGVLLVGAAGITQKIIKR